MTFVCSGRGAATQESCTFRTDDFDAAMTHFETSGHDVERVDRHARWDTYNVLDQARDRDLRDRAGTLVRATLGTGGWHILSAGASLNTESAASTAAHLNYIGALPQAEHDALAFERSQAICSRCKRASYGPHGCTAGC